MQSQDHTARNAVTEVARTQSQDHTARNAVTGPHSP